MTPKAVVRGARGAVASGNPLATAAGLETLRAGGTAIDAAVAAAAVLWVVLPEAGGPGGDALMLVRAPGGAVTALNGSGAAPADLRRPVAADGGASVAVPGAVHALVEAQRRFGALALPRVLAPAVALAAEGFPASEQLVAALGRQRTRLEQGAARWGLVARPPVPGALVALPRLAVLLEAIGAHGAQAFYAGPMAEAVCAAVRRAGGTLTPADLEAHDTPVHPPLVMEHHGTRVVAQPPVSQAAFALAVLGELGRHRAAGVDRVHLAVEAIEGAFAHRDELVDAETARALLRAPLGVDPRVARRRGGPQGRRHTTAVATADARGGVVSLLISLFDEFGSAVLVPEGDLLLNNRLSGFSSDPRSPNAPGPRRRPVHTLAPFLVETPTHTLALATPGADAQVQIMVQLIDGLAAEGLQPAAALARPRWRSVDAALYLEPAFSRRAAAALSARGHAVERGQPTGAAFGIAVLAGREREHDTLLAAADPRGEASAIAF